MYPAVIFSFQSRKSLHTETLFHIGITIIITKFAIVVNLLKIKEERYLKNL